MEFTRVLALGCAIAIAAAACGSDDDTTPPNTNNNNTNTNTNTDPNPTCGADATLDPTATSDTQLLNCDGLGVIDVPIEVTLSAKPLGAVSSGASTDFEVQVALVLNETIVGTLGGLVSDATIGEASADVGDGMVDSINIAATVPCDVDFTVDSDNNMMAGPVVVATPTVTQTYTESGGRIELQAPDVTFAISSPPPLMLTTKGDSPACVWDADVPTISFAAQ